MRKHSSINDDGSDFRANMEEPHLVQPAVANHAIPSPWLKQKLLLHALPAKFRWGTTLGWLLVFTFVLQAVTGVLLALNYAPSVKTAWHCVSFIEHEVAFGSFVRALHHWGTSAMVILLVLHLVRVFLLAAYKRPRQLIWVVGVLLFFCTVAFAITGDLLPWDQEAYWAAKVRLSMVAATPVMGEPLRDLVQGGPIIGNLTLTRFFTLHTLLLPGVFIALLLAHGFLYHRHGTTPAWWRVTAGNEVVPNPFWPDGALRLGLVGLVFVVGLGLWSFYRPAPLEAEANPSRSFDARPEWFFMFLFYLHKIFAGRYEIVATFILPALTFSLMLLWPFLDRSPHRSPRQRPVAIGLFALGAGALTGLTVYPMATDTRNQELLGSAVAAVTPAPAENTVDRSAAAKLFNETCTACHGSDGTGSRMRAQLPSIPNFTSFSWQITQTDETMIHFIENGTAPVPHSYRDKFTPEQIAALALYVRSFSFASDARAAGAGSPSRSGPAALTGHPAAALYREHCLACHDADGRGSAAKTDVPNLSIPDFTSQKWQMEMTDSQLLAGTLDGKGTAMPPFRGKISEQDAKQLVSYIRGFAPVTANKR
jgi:ubiquinol-cytochrome c reductase cytochrome b subunit